MENSALARFVKLQGKTSIAEFTFIKVVGQKSDGVINTEFFLNVFWKGWQLEVKGNSKIKIYGIYLWDFGYVFRGIWVENQTWGTSGESDEFFLKFHHFFPSRILPNKFFSPLKTLPVEHIFPSRN